MFLYLPETIIIRRTVRSLSLQGFAEIFVGTRFFASATHPTEAVACWESKEEKLAWDNNIL